MSEVEEIKNRISIVDLVGEYIRLQKAGGAWRALCPFHNEKTPSMMVSEERRSFHCFGCGKGGDIFTFVMEMEGLGFREALEQLAQKAGVELKRFEKGDLRFENKDGKKKLFEILELATKWYEKNLWEGQGKGKILEYLRGRGLTDQTIKQFRLGYAPDGWDNMLNFLIKKDFKIQDIEKTGLLVKKEIPNSSFYDRFRDRIMFPIQDIMGRVVGYSARVSPGGDEKTAKYINTPQTALYDKSRILYGLHLAKTEIRKRDEAILVEGNMDVIASHQAGFPNTIAVSGTALTPEQLKMIKRYTENIKMGFDMDAAGQAAAKRSIKICLENELDVKIILLTSGKDAADVIRDNPKLWQEAVESSEGVLDYYFKEAFARYDPKSAVDKKKIARELLNVIKDITSPVEKAHWVKVLAEKIGTDEKVLFEVISKVKAEKKEPAFRPQESEAQLGEEKFPSQVKRIIGILTAFPKECRREFEKLKTDDFEKGKGKEIISAIKERKENASLEALKVSFPDYETGRMLDEAAFEAEVEFEGSTRMDPEGELKRSLDRWKQENVRKKINQVAQSIKAAEKNGDKKAVKDLMGEFQNLTELLS